jgi:hypothetical protein
MEDGSDLRKLQGLWDAADYREDGNALTSHAKLDFSRTRCTFAAGTPKSAPAPLSHAAR